MIFDELDYFSHKFPEPQYLGAKYNLLSWIIKHIPKNINTVIDAFAGTQSVAFLFKQLGHQVFSNDFLTFNHQIGLSLIENKNQTLTKEDTNILFSENPNKSKFTLIEDVYTDLFFEREQAYFLDNFRANIDFLENCYKKSLALTLMNRSLQRKITMGHFAHTQALVYANNQERIKRNPNLARPIQTIFMDMLADYNYAVFDNQKDNKSFSQDILDLLPNLLKDQTIDLAYFDPPYCDSHADYQSFYHLTETYTEYWQNKQFVNTIKRYEPQKLSGFDKKINAVESLEKLFEQAKEIPYWLMSYNNRSYPDISVLTAMLKKHKEVEVETKIYGNSRGGKGSVAGSQEVLFICKPKKKFICNKWKTENDGF